VVGVSLLISTIGSGGTPSAAAADATATASAADATATIAARPGGVLYSDSLTDSPTGWVNNSSCSFASDGYHVRAATCLAPVSTLADVDVTVKATPLIENSSSLYHLEVRWDDAAGTTYDFAIGIDGGWTFNNCSPSACTPIVHYTLNAAIHRGLNTTNRLEVVDKGTHFDFYVNSVKVGQANDATYASGQVGLGGASGGAEVRFNDIVIKRPI
jgi:hypothetical protein